MKNLGISILLAVIMAGLFIGGLELFGARDEAAPAAHTIADFNALRSDLESVSSDLSIMKKKIDRMEAEQNKASLAVEAEKEKKKTPEQPDLYSNEMRDYVFALIDEERELRKDESAQRRDDHRKEVEEFKEGNFGSLNLKINSIGSLLNLDDVQKDNYYELHKFYNEKSDKLREGVDWRDREVRKNTMEQYKKLQEEFSVEVENILTDEQREVYDKLPSWSRSLHNKGYVSPPGKEAEGIRTNIEQMFKGFQRRRRSNSADQ